MMFTLADMDPAVYSFQDFPGRTIMQVRFQAFLLFRIISCVCVVFFPPKVIPEHSAV